MKEKGFVMRRIYEARLGYAMYMGFLIQMSTSIVVVYTLVIAFIPELDFIFPNLYAFGALFVIVVISIAISLGHFGYIKGGQLGVEVMIQSEKNPYFMDLIRDQKKIMRKLGIKSD